MRKYCVDVHWDVAKVFYGIEAESPEEAEQIVAEKCREINGTDGKTVLRHLAELGFESCEGYEIAASGTQDAKGMYQFGDV